MRNILKELNIRHHFEPLNYFKALKLCLILKL